ncbi:tRNA dihydrouridine synthase [Desulfocicer vacuolatum]|nr:tRNA-dihydrouridine synthase family protein [Desulfocicer vacuolatum]
MNFINTPLTIKNSTISNRLLLAPMAGLGHIAFRELVSEFGGYGLLFTGMCSAKAVPHENPAVSPVFKWRTEELPHLVCQIFGPDPESMARAARRIEKEGFFGVDLNFGCSVSAICKKGSGAILLKSPDLAVAIVKAVRQAVEIPVFVKFRTGWENNVTPAVDMARRFEDAGAHALVFHPRIAPDRRSRPPVWDHITHVKQAVSIPVFGNGNLFELSDCKKMYKQTGCDGFSMGRMAVARPWLFAQWTRGFVPDEHTAFNAALRMTQLLVKYHDERTAVKSFKKYVPYFAAGFKFGHAICKELLKGDEIREIQDIITSLAAQKPESALRPNLHLFS